MKNLILMACIVTFISCNNCVDDRIARVAKVETIVYEAGRTARMQSKLLVKIVYSIENKNYRKEFISYKSHYVGQVIKIKTAKDPNHFCVVK